MKPKRMRDHNLREVLPRNLVKEIDKVVGATGRSAFLAELATREIRRRRLVKTLKQTEPIWKDQDHPELKDGAAQWIRKLRAETEARFERIQQRRDRN